MIKSVTVINYLGESLELNLTSSHEDHGLYIKKIEGIGPEKATINTVSLASDDGGIFNSARADIRNIVLTIGFYESLELHNTIEDSRHKTYRYFPLKRLVRLIFETDIRTISIDGYVESNVPDIFSDSETTQISIICPDPKFYDLTSIHNRSFGSNESMFHFPYSNNSLTENLTIMGILRFNEARILTYYGDEETGVTITIIPKNNLRGLEIADISTESLIRIDDSEIARITNSDGILAGDEIVIVTINGKKSAILSRNGTPFNIISSLGRSPSWFKLFKGDNVFLFSAESGYENLEMSISYIDAYMGV